MSKIVGVLFPWRKTFKRLELQKLWWHRLAIVVFSVVLMIGFLSSWMIGDDAFGPVNSSNQDIRHWGPSSNGIRIDLDSILPLDNTLQRASPPPSTIQKTIEMPDEKTATYPGTTSDEAIKAEWNHKLNIATANAILLGFVIAVLVTLAFSYLLQASYRALLYVVYGAKPDAASDSTAI